MNPISEDLYISVLKDEGQHVRVSAHFWQNNITQQIEFVVPKSDSPRFGGKSLRITIEEQE